MSEAVALLEGLAVGEAIFRPSSQGVNHISLSMKVGPAVRPSTLQCSPNA